MGRSPLFHKLRQLARRAHAANSGVEPPEPSRREFLRAAAIVPLAAACGDNKPAVGPGPVIAIVGGGMAGLTVSHFLGLAGVRAEIYEASTRIGGRMYTHRGAPLQGGQLCELGGELIDTGHIVMQTLAGSYGLPLDDLPETTPGLVQDLFYFNGSVVADATIVSQFMPVAMKMAMAVAAGDASATEFDRIDNLSIVEWLATEANLPVSSLIRQLLEVAYLEEFGLEPSEQSAWNLITLIDYETPDPFRVFGDSDERYHMHFGNDALPQKIAQQLEDRIFFEHALVEVAGEGDRFALTFANDRTIVADHVVYALPFTKLREVELGGSGLSAGKRIIIDELGYGTNAKLMLQFTDRHWELAPRMSNGSSISDVGDLQSTWATSRGQDGPQGILTNFVGGGRGITIGAGSAESQAQMVLPWIDTVFPGTAARYLSGTAIRQHWPTYEFTKGSYASYKKGQWSFFGREGTREGNQHFCGEHCSENWQGYMEGAAETGTLVAAEILDDLGIAYPPVLASLVEMLTETSPRACYHAGFGKRMKLSQIRRR